MKAESSNFYSDKLLYRMRKSSFGHAQESSTRNDVAPSSDTYFNLRIRTLFVVFLWLCLSGPTEASQGQPSGQQDDHMRQQREYLEKLNQRDTCGTVYTSELHGYQVREYKLTLADSYEIVLHRLIHPEDQPTNANEQRMLEERLKRKKPYLLVHGLIGTSASFVLNIDDQYRAPPRTFRAHDRIVDLLKSKASTYQYEWESTANRLQRLNDQMQRDRWSKKNHLLADQNHVIYDGDELNFASEFRQAYNKFDMPKEALDHTTNSLAFTLSNFGYDVWMINMRGNEYSKKFNGRMTSSWDEYWTFDIGTLVREDLIAATNKIQSQRGAETPVGLVTYSYSAAYAMNLLTKFPEFAHKLQPIVMLAPTLMTGARDRKQKSLYVLKLIKALLSKTGPFPTMSRIATSKKRSSISSSISSLIKLDWKLARLACKMPIASHLCRFMENMLHGDSERVSTVKGLILPIGHDWRALSLRQRDNDCGRTSKAILHQIFDNINQENIPADFMAFESVQRRQLQNRMRPQSGPPEAPLRRSVILIHAQDDEMATMAEVQRIRSTALKTLTLLDYVIRVPNFSHSDFLFSRQNQYLVNAEIARQVLLYDFLADQPYAHEPSRVPRGI